MADPKAQSKKDIFSTLSVQFIFDKTFPRDGLDPYRLGKEQDFYYAPTDTKYGLDKPYLKIEDDTTAIESNLSNAKLPNLTAAETLKTNLLSFFGIPNRLTRPETNQQLTALQVLKNCIGYPNKDSHKIQKYAMYTGIVPLAILLLNLATIVLKTAFNSVKLLTEFLPLLIILGANQAIAALYKIYKLDSVGHFTIGHIGIAFFNSCSYLAQGIFLIGRAITSPVNSVRAAWNYATGMKLNEQGELTETHNIKNPILRVLAGSLLVALSLATSFAMYAIAFPAVFHAIAIHTPALYHFVTTLFVNVINPFYSIGLVQHLSNALLAFSQWSVNHILGSVNYILAHTVDNVVLATLDVSLATIAVAVVTIASVAENLRKPLANWWYQKRNLSTGTVRVQFTDSLSPKAPLNSEDKDDLEQNTTSAIKANKDQVYKNQPLIKQAQQTTAKNDESKIEKDDSSESLDVSSNFHADKDVETARLIK